MKISDTCKIFQDWGQKNKSSGGPSTLVWSSPAFMGWLYGPKTPRNGVYRSDFFSKWSPRNTLMDVVDLPINKQTDWAEGPKWPWRIQCGPARSLPLAKVSAARPITMWWMCAKQNRDNLNESITLGHLYLEIRVLSSKIGRCWKTQIGLNFRAKNKSPHGGLRNTHPQASMRGFFFSLEIEADIPFFDTAKC